MNIRLSHFIIGAFLCTCFITPLGVVKAQTASDELQRESVMQMITVLLQQITVLQELLDKKIAEERSESKSSYDSHLEKEHTSKDVADVVKIKNEINPDDAPEIVSFTVDSNTVIPNGRVGIMYETTKTKSCSIILNLNGSKSTVSQSGSLNADMSMLVPSQAKVGDDLRYKLSCASRSSSYHRSVENAVEEIRTVKVVTD